MVVAGGLRRAPSCSPDVPEGPTGHGSRLCGWKSVCLSFPETVPGSRRQHPRGGDKSILSSKGAMAAFGCCSARDKVRERRREPWRVTSPAGPCLEHSGSALLGNSYPAWEDTSSAGIRGQGGRGTDLTHCGGRMKELSPPSEAEKLTVVPRFLQITQDSTLLGRFKLVFLLPFDVSVLSPAGS